MLPLPLLLLLLLLLLMLMVPLSPNRMAERLDQRRTMKVRKHQRHVVVDLRKLAQRRRAQKS